MDGWLFSASDERHFIVVLGRYLPAYDSLFRSNLECLLEVCWPAHAASCTNCAQQTRQDLYTLLPGCFVT